MLLWVLALVFFLVAGILAGLERAIALCLVCAGLVCVVLEMGNIVNA
jgi:hypothetical protein